MLGCRVSTDQPQLAAAAVQGRPRERAGSCSAAFPHCSSTPATDPCTLEAPRDAQAAGQASRRGHELGRAAPDLRRKACGRAASSSCCQTLVRTSHSSLGTALHRPADCPRAPASQRSSALRTGRLASCQPPGARSRQARSRSAGSAAPGDRPGSSPAASEEGRRCELDLSCPQGAGGPSSCPRTVAAAPASVAVAAAWGPPGQPAERPPPKQRRAAAAVRNRA